MQNIARSARSQRRRMASLLSGVPHAPSAGAPGASEIALDHPVEDNGITYRTLTIRPPSIVDFAHVTRCARGKHDRGVMLTAMCCGVPTDVILNVEPIDGKKI